MGQRGFLMFLMFHGLNSALGHSEALDACLPAISIVWKRHYRTDARRLLLSIFFKRTTLSAEFWSFPSVRRGLLSELWYLGEFLQVSNSTFSWNWRRGETDDDAFLIERIDTGVGSLLTQARRGYNGLEAKCKETQTSTMISCWESWR